MYTLSRSCKRLVVASGDGRWGLEKGTQFHFVDVKISVEDGSVREAYFFHDLAVNDVRPDDAALLNPVFDNGIPYTDSASHAAALALLIELFPEYDFTYCVGSDRFAQGESYLHCDVEGQVREKNREHA